MDSDWLSSHFTKSEQNTMRIMATVSAGIEMKRVETGMTIKEFSRAYGISRRKIRKWESRNYNFRLSELVLICDILGGKLELYV